MSGSKGLKRYNGVEQDDEGAYVYYDEHIAALRRAKAEGRQEAQDLLEEAYQVMSLWFKYFNSDIRPVDEWTEVAERVNDWLPRARDARAAKIEEGE